jgi:protein TonB
MDRPVYPKEAQALGIQGVVIVEVVVDEDGAVTDAKVLRSIPLLDDEALRAVRTWRFAPTKVNGQAVPVRMNVSVSFTDR